MLAVADKQQQKCFNSPAGNVGGENDFYTLSRATDDPELVDGIWDRYESQLVEAIESLIAGRVDAITWARVLVPFVACTLVRGKDFEDRFKSRFPESRSPLGDLANQRDNVNIARLMELQRLLSPVCAAEWRVLEVDGPGDLIVGDVGFIASQDLNDRKISIAIPLGKRHVLLLKPTSTRKVLEFTGDSWKPVIQCSKLSPNSHQGLCRVLAHYARRFIFGASEEMVRRFLSSEVAADIPGPWDLGFIPPALAAVHEFNWHRLVSMLETDAKNPQASKFEMNYTALKAGWCPMILRPTNLPDFEPAISRIGTSIVMHFYDVDPFDHAQG